MSSIASPAGQFLSFRLGAEIFGIDVRRVREVLDLSPITRVPQGADFMLGVVNVRGSAVPVIDLRARFGLPPAEPTLDTRIVVLDLAIDDGLTAVGAMADAVNEVIEFEENQIAPPPKLAIRWRSDFVRGLAERDEHFLILLDIDRILGSNEVMLAAEAAKEKGPDAP